MTRILLTIALAASVVAGCDTTDTTGPVTYTSNDLTYVEPDECDFFINNEELVAVVTVLGSTVTMVVQSVDNPDSQFEVSADDYDPMQNDVTLTSLSVNNDKDPCVVQLDDAFRLTLDDPDLSLEEQDSLSVTWDHAEMDISSAWTDACSLDADGDPLDEILWFIELPCAGEATLSMTKQSDAL